MNAVCGTFHGLWTRWNCQVESGTRKIVEKVGSFLPRSILHHAQGEFMRQSQIVVHSVALLTLFGATLGNPYVSTPAALISAGMGVVATVQPFCRFLKEHIVKTERMPGQVQDDIMKWTVASIGICSLIGILGKYTVIPAGIRANVAAFAVCSLVAICVDVVASSIIMQKHLKKKTEEDAREEVLQKREFVQLTADVKELERRVVLFETFVSNHPKFKVLYEKHQLENPDDIDPLPGISDDERSENCALACYKISLKCALEVRKIFISSIPELIDFFEQEVDRFEEKRIEYVHPQ